MAGAAYLLNNNAGVLRRAQCEQKSHVEHKGKGSLDLCTLSNGTNTGESQALRSFSGDLNVIGIKLEVSEKLPQG